MNMPSRNWSTPFHLRRLPNLRIWIGYQCYVEHLKTKNRPCHLVTSGTVRPQPGVWTVSSSVSPYWPFRHSVFSALNTLWHFVFNKKSIQLFRCVLFCKMSMSDSDSPGPVWHQETAENCPTRTIKLTRLQCEVNSRPGLLVNDLAPVRRHTFYFLKKPYPYQFSLLVPLVLTRTPFTFIRGRTKLFTSRKFESLVTKCVYYQNYLYFSQVKENGLMA